MRLEFIYMGFADEMSKIAADFPKPVTVKRTIYPKNNPSGRSGYVKQRKMPHLSVARRSSEAAFNALPPAQGPNPFEK